MHLKKCATRVTGKTSWKNEMVEDDIRIDGNKISFSLIFQKPTDPFIKSIVKAAEQAILHLCRRGRGIKGNISVKKQTSAETTTGT